jgi:hypothetical protein
VPDRIIVDIAIGGVAMSCNHRTLTPNSRRFV